MSAWVISVTRYRKFSKNNTGTTIVMKSNGTFHWNRAGIKRYNKYNNMVLDYSVDKSGCWQVKTGWKSSGYGQWILFSSLFLFSDHIWNTYLRVGLLNKTFYKTFPFIPWSLPWPIVHLPGQTGTLILRITGANFDRAMTMPSGNYYPLTRV